MAIYRNPNESPLDGVTAPATYDIGNTLFKSYFYYIIKLNNLNDLKFILI